MLLLIETSTEVCSVGISRQGQLLAMREDTSERLSHAEKATGFIDAVMATVDCTFSKLKAVAVGAGPGSYTGLRIGTSLAKGICYANDIPLISVSSLRTIAWGIKSSLPEAEQARSLVPMIDARRMEVYTTVLTFGMEEQLPFQPMVLDEEGAALLCKDKIAVGGNGAHKLTHDQALLVPEIHTSVKWMAELAEQKWLNQDFEDLAYYVPFYGKAAQPTLSKEMKDAQRNR